MTGGCLKTRAQHKAASRDKIMAAARRLFERDGYEATTIRGVGKAAGLTAGAVFVHTHGKADLFKKAMRRDPPDQDLPAFLAALGSAENGVVAIKARELLRDLVGDRAATSALKAAA